MFFNVLKQIKKAVKIKIKKNISELVKSEESKLIILLIKCVNPSRKNPTVLNKKKNINTMITKKNNIIIVLKSLYLIDLSFERLILYGLSFEGLGIEHKSLKAKDIQKILNKMQITENKSIIFHHLV